MTSRPLFGVCLLAWPMLASATEAIETRAPTSTSTSLPPALTAPPKSPVVELDTIFPIANQTYNWTTSLPIVFAIRNLSAAAAHGNVTFVWDFTSWQQVGGRVNSGGVTEDREWFYFKPETTPKGTWIMINQTNIRKWDHGPGYHGTVYALEWALSVYSSDREQCGVPGLRGQTLFTVSVDTSEPDLRSATECPQFDAAMELNPTTGVSICEAAATVVSSGSPCGLTVDKAMATIISSEWQRLIPVSEEAESAYSTWLHPKTASRSGASNEVRANSGKLAVVGAFAGLYIL